MVNKKDIEETKLMKNIDNIWEFIAYALRYRTKELLSLLLTIAIIIILWQNISITSDKDGTHFNWGKAAEINITR